MTSKQFSSSRETTAACLRDDGTFAERENLFETSQRNLCHTALDYGTELRSSRRTDKEKTYEELRDESVIEAAGWNSDKEKTYELRDESKIVARTPTIGRPTRSRTESKPEVGTLQTTTRRGRRFKTSEKERRAA